LQAFFTYLYSASILYLLYVFCYLLTGNGRPERRPPPKKKKEKKEKKKDKSAEEASSPSQAQKNKGALFQVSVLFNQINPSAFAIYVDEC